MLIWIKILTYHIHGFQSTFSQITQQLLLNQFNAFNVFLKLSNSAYS
jgi:hypothetical protein